MKRFWVLLAIIAGIGVVLAAVKLTNRSDSAMQLAMVKVHRGALQTKLPENGVVQHPRAATVPTLVAGNIGEMDARPGDAVEGGQLLATIQNPTLESTAAGSQADYNSAVANIRTARIDEQNARVTYQGALATAKSNLDEAQRIYDEDVALFKEQAIPRNQLDTDKANLDKMRVAYDQAARQLRLGAVTGYGESSVQYAQAAADKAAITNSANQQQLGFTRIVAPFAGIIQSVATQPNDPLTPLHAGDPVTQGQMLFTIAQRGNYIVKAEVDEQDVINVRVGQTALVSGQDFPGKQLTGAVAAIAPIATKSTDASSTARQVLTTIRLDSSPAFLRDGMTVDVDILTSNVRNALLVPTGALASENGKTYVYAVRNGIARKVRVSIGKSNDAQTIVTAGLVPGDTIVAQKTTGLRDGARVTASPSPSPGAS